MLKLDDLIDFQINTTLDNLSNGRVILSVGLGAVEEVAVLAIDGVGVRTLDRAEAGRVGGVSVVHAVAVAVVPEVTVVAVADIRRAQVKVDAIIVEVGERTAGEIRLGGFFHQLAGTLLTNQDPSVGHNNDKVFHTA